MEELTINSKAIIDYFDNSKLIDYLKVNNENYPIFPNLYDITENIKDAGWLPFRTCDQHAYQEYQFSQHIDFPQEIEKMNKIELLKRYLQVFTNSFSNALDDHIIKELQKSARTVNLSEVNKTKLNQRSTIISIDLVKKSDNMEFGGRFVSYALDDKNFITINNPDNINYCIYDDNIYIKREFDKIYVLGDLRIGFNLEGLQLYKIL